MQSSGCPSSASPALPVIDRRVASILASFGGAGCEIHRVSPAPCASGIADDQYPSCPEILILRHRLTTVRVTSDCAPSGSPRLITRVAPATPPWLRRRDQFPGCPKSRVSSPFADSLRFGSPRTYVPRLTRICFTGCPASASATGSMMSPWLNRTLHPRLASRMNLRLQSGHNNPDPALSALSISILPPTVGKPTTGF